MKLSIPKVGTFAWYKPLGKLHTYGITNRVPNEPGWFYLFLDYDKVEYYVVEEDIALLQKEFDCGPCVTRISSTVTSYPPDGKEIGNYHVLFFTKFRFPEILKLMRYIRCDEFFKFSWKYHSHRSWVLRFGPKRNEKGLTSTTETIFHRYYPSDTSRTLCPSLIYTLSLFDPEEGIYQAFLSDYKNSDYNMIERVEYIASKTKKK